MPDEPEKNDYLATRVAKKLYVQLKSKVLCCEIRALYL